MAKRKPRRRHRYSPNLVAHYDQVEALEALSYRERWRQIEACLNGQGDFTFRAALRVLEEATGRRATMRLRRLAVESDPKSQIICGVADREGSDGWDFYWQLLNDPTTPSALLDDFADWLGFALSNKRRPISNAEAKAMVERLLSDPCPDVRFTACFRIGCRRMSKYLPQLLLACDDRAMCQYGMVNEVASLAIRRIQGEDVEMHAADFTNGAYIEYIALPADFRSPIPPTLSESPECP